MFLWCKIFVVLYELNYELVNLMGICEGMYLKYKMGKYDWL